MVRDTQGFDMSILYHLGKANVVDDSLSRLSISSATHFKEDTNKL